MEWINTIDVRIFTWKYQETLMFPCICENNSHTFKRWHDLLLLAIILSWQSYFSFLQLQLQMDRLLCLLQEGHNVGQLVQGAGENMENIYFKKLDITDKTKWSHIHATNLKVHILPRHSVMVNQAYESTKQLQKCKLQSKWVFTGSAINQLVFEFYKQPGQECCITMPYCIV